MNTRFRLTRTLLEFAAWIFGILLLLLVIFHLWFVHHSEEAIEDLVAWQSNGKMKAEMKKFRIDYFNNEIEIKNLSMFNTDTLKQGVSYRFTTQNFRFKIRSKWDWIFHKELLIDSVFFNSPDIVITRRGVAETDTVKKKLILAEELGNVYKTISQSLSVLKLQRFEITEGKILMKDANSNKAPFRLSHIFFSIDKLNMDSANANKFIFSDRVTLRIGGQVILLPDNKSNIAFSELKIDSKDRYINITNPVINIFPSAEQKTSFIGSASKLNITGLDFNVLYKEPLIKMDSVFMQDPTADLQLYADEKNKDDDNKKKISLDSTLRHLQVAVDINHVVVQNGAAEMGLHQAGKTTTFQSKNDNLSIVGIQVNDTATNVLSIGGFNYTIRNYTGYTPDSVYRFRFDSLQFIDNKIILYNFVATTIKEGKANLIRQYTVPRFEITDMDWLSFIFYNHFKARDAVLYNAVMNLEKNYVAIADAKQRPDKKSIYQILSVLDNLLDLDELKIVNSHFTFKQGNNLHLELQHLNLDVNAHQLTEAKSFNQLMHSVKEVLFDSAIITNSAMDVHIAQSSFNDKEESLLFKNVLLNTANKTVAANLNAVELSDFSFDDNGLEVNGIHWKDGVIHFKNIQSTTRINKKINAPAFVLNGIKANNTTVFFDNGNTNAQAFLKTVSANSLSKPVDDVLSIDGLLVAGDSAVISLPDGEIKCNYFIIHDEGRSMLRNILFERKTNDDTTLVQIPSFSFIPFINKTLAAKILSVDSVEIEQPNIVLSIKKDIKENDEEKQSSDLPKLGIKNFNIKDASLQLRSYDKNEKTNTACEKLSFNAGYILTQDDKSILFNDIFLFANGNTSLVKNDTISIKSNGDINIDASKFVYKPGTSAWEMWLSKFNSDSIQYSSGKFGEQTLLSVNKLNIFNTIISNKDFVQPLPWLINKSNATVNVGSFSLHKNDINLLLNDIQFNQNKKHLSIDSFYIDPGQNREGFINHLIYREDYMQANSKKIDIDGISLVDGLWSIPRISIAGAKLNVYSDKLKQAGTETLQPLPVAAIKKIATAFKIDMIQLDNMAVHYTELNADTRHTGNVDFTNINGNVLNLASKPTPAFDSLRVNITASFLDSIPMKLQFSESYDDPLGGLCLQLQLGNGSIGLLNPFLAPLASLEAKSGYLDKMEMVAYGNEYTSHGTMRMYYHGLKAGILDSGDVQHQKIGTKLLTLFANDFAIRGKNKKHYTDFYFVRSREKSSIGFLLKMIVQGAAGNVSPITKMLYRKQYKKDIKKMQETQGNITQ